MEEVKCSNPSCSWKVVVMSQDGHFRLATRALKTRGEGESLVAVCRRCNEETVLPYTLTPRPIEKSGPRPKRRGFTVIYKGEASELGEDGT